MKEFDEKWSWSQAFSDSNGKSSISPVIGMIIAIAGVAAIVVQLIVYYKTKDIALVPMIIAVLTLATGLILMHKKVDGDLSKIIQELPDNQITQTIKTAVGDSIQTTTSTNTVPEKQTDDPVINV